MWNREVCCEFSNLALYDGLGVQEGLWDYFFLMVVFNVLM